MATTILVAGGTGNLGSRIVRELLRQQANVRVLVRPSGNAELIEEFKRLGAEIIETDLHNLPQLTAACQGVDCVVSALQGLGDVIVETQSRLLEAAVAAGVPRFIPSDFASDFTKIPDGENRNFDLRREFMRHIDSQPIRATSILNGAFADMLLYGMPLLDRSAGKVAYWEDPNWRIDFTTMDDTAIYTAAAALDDSTPRLLRIASFQISPAELAAEASDAFGTRFELVRSGSLADLTAYNKQQRAAHPEGENEIYPSWQQSQYMQSMFSVQNQPLDNNRYPQLKWTSFRDLVSSAAKRGQRAEMPG